MNKFARFLLILSILSVSLSAAAQQLTNDTLDSTSVLRAADLSSSSSGGTKKSADEVSISISEIAQHATGNINLSDSQSSTAASDATEDSTVFSIQKGEALTAFQLQLQEAIKQRKAAGLPVPSVTYEHQATSKDAWQSITGATAPDGPVMVTSKTVIQFANPEQAGYEQWPPLTFNKLASPGTQGTVTVDYTEAYREYMEKQSPGIWQTYEFGHEPRNHTIVETFEIVYPERSSSPATAFMGIQAETAEDILMGFTYSGPHIDLSIEDSLTIPCPLPFCDDIEVYDFKAGVDLDWAFGLRLPAAANLTGPDQLVLGSPFSLASALTPQDWAAANYNNFGVAPENGNEFVARFNYFIGIRGEILGQDLCELIFGVQCFSEENRDISKSFATPFGSGSSFPISDLSETIPIIDLGIIEWDITFLLQPQVGSDKITADWQASGDASGSGQITYSSPGSPVSFGPINACNLGPGNQAQIELANFQYFFNQFAIEFKITNRLTIDVGFDDFSFEETVTLGLDLSSIFGGLGLQVGRHMQCDALFNCTATGPDNTLNLSIPAVDLTPPITTLTASGTAGNNGWYVSDVQVSLSATDFPDGCGIGLQEIEYSFDGTNWNIYTGPFTLSNEGTTNVYFHASDGADNLETTRIQTIKIDKTPPTITGAPTIPSNAYGWYNTDVVVHFDASDAVSGIDTVTPDQTLSSEGANQSVTGTAVDMAGLTASFTVMGINIDKTSPDLSITSPEARAYENTETFDVIWIAADSLSGLASERGAIDGGAVANGQSINLLIFGPGSHTLTVEVTDKADNTTSASVVFTVSVNSEGLLAALQYICDLGWIDKHGICNSLEAKLNAAIKSIERGNLNAAENQLNAFLHELEAQNGKSVNQSAYDVLTADALYVIEHLSDEE